MSIRIDGHEQIADQLEAAAAIIDRHGLATGALIAPHPGHCGALRIAYDAEVAVSPLGALVLANSPGPGLSDYELPYGWDGEPDALWAAKYPVVGAFAQFLVTTGRVVWGTDPGATISDWARQPGLSKDEAVAVLKAASKAVELAGPHDPMWTGDH